LTECSLSVDFPIGHPITDGCDAGPAVLTGSAVAFDRTGGENYPFSGLPARRVLPRNATVGHQTLGIPVRR